MKDAWAMLIGFGVGVEILRAYLRGSLKTDQPTQPASVATAPPPSTVPSPPSLITQPSAVPLAAEVEIAEAEECCRVLLEGARVTGVMMDNECTIMVLDNDSILTISGSYDVTHR